ncbi:MAG: hypothetical protein KDA93_20670 [Planctomycetaceae bacterium]|nr:hypothetical protein [Planctomycetaceae bacterium]
MSTNPIPSGPSDDELELLAEDLLGIDLSADQADLEPFEVEEFDLDDDLFGEEVPIAEEVTSVADEQHATSPARVDLDSDDDDFGASLLDDDEDTVHSAIVATLDDEEDALFVDVDEIDEESEGELDEEDEQEEASDDTYWDALEGWEWDDEPPKKSAPETRTSHASAERRTPSDETTRASLNKTDELLEDDDFGAGLEGDTSIVEAGASSDATPDDGDDESESRPRRRRRRGRRRRPKKEATTESVVDDSEADEFDEDEIESDDLESLGESDLAADDDDGFGAGLDVEASGGEKGPEKKRRRSRGGRRRRGRRSAGSDSQEAASQEQGDDAPALKSQSSVTDESDSDDNAGRSTREPNRYHNVPTWEEAISYLTRPSGGRPSGSSESKSGGQRSSGGRGRSRRGRRGGGKSKSSND